MFRETAFVQKQEQREIFVRTLTISRLISPCSLQSPVAPQPPSYRNDVHAKISLRNTCELLCEAGVQLCLSHRHELYTSLQKSRLHSIIEPVFDNLACRALSDLFFPRTRVATGQGLIYPDTEQTMSICS